jgi:hypothetical protein
MGVNHGHPDLGRDRALPSRSHVARIVKPDGCQGIRKRRGGFRHAIGRATGRCQSRGKVVGYIGSRSLRHALDRRSDAISDAARESRAFCRRSAVLTPEPQDVVAELSVSPRTAVRCHALPASDRGLAELSGALSAGPGAKRVLASHPRSGRPVSDQFFSSWFHPTA